MKEKATSLTVGIIGFGSFGSLTASILKKHASIKIYTREQTPKKRKAANLIGAKLVSFKEACACSIVIIAVPISNTEKTIKEIARYAKKGTIVLDVCSVKVLPCQWLKKHIPAPVEILGTHPMFGPQSTNFNFIKQTWSLKGLQIVLCPLRIKKKKLNQIKKFLKNLGLEVIETTPTYHDQQNAITLSLVHFLGNSLWQAGVREQEIHTPGLQRLLSIYNHTLKDTRQLLYDMNNYNPYASAVRQRFIRACRIMDDKIEKNHPQRHMLKFIRQMIDRIDEDILWLFKKRFEYVKRVGKVKQKQGVPIVDKKRERQMIKKRVSDLKNNPRFVKKLYQLIIEEACIIQRNQRDK